MIRVRLKFTKTGDLRWLSHLEMSRTINRIVKRAALPVEYSRGFSPHPKMSLSPALPVGVASLSEYLDIVLAKEMRPEQIVKEFNRAAPPGLRAAGAARLPDGAPAPSAAISCADYRLEIRKPVGEPRINAAWQLIRKISRGTALRLSPICLSFLGTARQRDVTIISVRLPINIRLAQVTGCLIDTIGLKSEDILVDRMAQWIVVDDGLVEPLDVSKSGNA